MIRINYLIVTLLYISCVGCTSSGTGGKNKSVKILEKSHFNIKIYTNEPEKANLEDITSDYYFIELRADKDFHIKRVDKLFVTDSILAVADFDQKAIFLFDKTGKPVNKIQKIGRGEQEYEYMTDVIFDTRNNVFDILDISTQRVFCYGIDGTFKNVKKINAVKYAGFRFEKKESFYVFGRINKNVDGNELGIFNDNSKIEFNASAITIPGILKGIKYVTTKHLFETYHDSLFYIPPISNKVYSIDNDSTLSSYLTIDIPKENNIPTDSVNRKSLINFVNYEHYMSSHSLIHNIGNLYMNEKFITFNYQSGHNRYKNDVFYSKKTHVEKEYDEYDSRKFPSFKFINEISAKFKDYFIVPLTVNYFASLSSQEKLKLPLEIQNNLTGNSNPVLLFYKLKDF